MTVRLARPIAGLLVLLALLPGALAAQAPEATPPASPVATDAAWRVLDEREVDIDTRHAALSPDGQWAAGVTHDDTFCIWEVVTLGSDCLDEPLPVRGVTITWSPDSTAVAFALDVALKLVDSDIYVVERESGALVNLTDDGVVGGTIDFFETGVPVDDMPTWSPDSQRIAFTRTVWRGESNSTSIMLVGRAGGEPVETLPLPGDTPLPVWMPMHWLPDGTLLYSQTMNDAGDPATGVWKVGVDDGGNPLRIVPGGPESEIPAPLIDDAASGRAIVYSHERLLRLPGQDQPVFWLLELASGDIAPIRVPGEAMVVNAGFSPDGNTALLVVNVEGDPALMVMDVATGAIAPLGDVPRGDAFLPGAPQWASNNTVLLQRPTGIGPLLLTLEPAG